MHATVNIRYLFIRRPSIDCCLHYLKQSAGQWDFSNYSVYVPPATETYLFSLSFPDIILDW